MTWPLTNKAQIVRHYTGKLLAGMSGMAIFALGAVIALWRVGVYSPNARWSAVLFGVPLFGLYAATIVNLLRLQQKLRGGTG